MPTRRQLLRLTAPASALGVLGLPDARGPTGGDLPAPIRALEPMTDGALPITVDEHRSRLERARELLVEQGLDALVVGPGSGLAYFTGVEWGLSERFFGMVLTRSGDPSWVTPAFEKERAALKIRIGTDVRIWEEESTPSR